MTVIEKTRSARINWGRGRLAAFSSKASFIAQFCRLNDLKPITLERFFASYLGCDEEWRCIFDAENSKPMAGLLDERHFNVNTLFGNHFALSACFGEFQLQLHDLNPEKYVSYCPVCAEIGYHSAFHEAPWLYRCLLHREPLKRFSVDGVGYSSHARGVTALLRDSCNHWPDVWSEAIQLDRAPHFCQFRRWLAATKDRSMQLYCENVVSLDENPYSFGNLEILLGRLASLAPIPAQLLEFFTAPPQPQRQIKVEVGRDAASAIKMLGDKFPLWLLLWYYSKYQSILLIRRRPRLLAEHAIAKLENEHAVCKCHWAWDRYAGWSPIHQDRKRPARLLCPYELAINELKERWLVFAPVGESPQAHKKIVNLFLDAGERVIECGLGYLPDSPILFPSGQGLHSCYLLPELTLGDDVEHLLDSLLAGQVIAHSDDLTMWLSAITADHEPIRATAAGSTNLFLDESSAWVSAWRNFGTRSVDAVERWGEGWGASRLSAKKTAAVHP